MCACVCVCGCMSSYCITTAVLTRDCAGPPTPVPCRRTPSSPTTSPTGRCTSTGEAAAAPRWAGPRAAAPPPGGRWCEEGQCPGAGSGSWRRGLTSRANFPSSRRSTDDCRTPTCVSQQSQLKLLQSKMADGGHFENRQNMIRLARSL